jgi:hypothetical protein
VDDLPAPGRAAMALALNQEGDRYRCLLCHGFHLFRSCYISHAQYNIIGSRGTQRAQMPAVLHMQNCGHLCPLRYLRLAQ